VLGQTNIASVTDQVKRETTANPIFLANVTIHIYKQIIVNLFPIFTNTILWFTCLKRRCKSALLIFLKIMV